ncbi:hypothetical protein ADU60_12495 [Vibrio coralliilyticus]|nr:hypothetical protein DVV14_14805 [Vibrio coralliilyticus]KPH26037.1 hypothetical protein ADU60_12495 [Vibrio coralliilyticus]
MKNLSVLHMAMVIAEPSDDNNNSKKPFFYLKVDSFTENIKKLYDRLVSESLAKNCDFVK